MSSFIFVERIKDKASQSVLASATTPVTSSFPMSDLDAKDISVVVKYDDAAVTNGITAVIQTSHDGGTTWTSHTSVVITAATATETRKYLHMNEVVSTTDFPLFSRGRIAIVTGVGDTATIDSVYVSRRTRK